MERILTENEAVQLAGKYFDRIANVINSAFMDYIHALNEMNSIGIKTDFKARTSASLIHDFIRTRAFEEFDDETNVKVSEFNGIFGLLILGKIFIRFKKLGRDLSTSNVRTDQVELFDKQQLELPGLGQLTMLTAGYVPDITYTSIHNMYLTCRRDDQIVWHKDIYSDTTQVSIFKDTSMDKLQTAEEEPFVRLKVQQGNEKKASDNG